ncbi:unnamed protein product [Parnassius apollo]|uniref:(apollo) hypothetical protein n=1 Tax=Parnassius apollo TaxID=110799 RepID=A0A8S3W2H7_PARAO|nr:unnamed protein product [Parnassius apollo]
MAIYRDVIVLEGNKVKSPTWLYFDVKDEENKLATCSLCQEVYSFRTSVTNLAKHLKYKHKLKISKSSDADGNVRKYVVEQEKDDQPEDNKFRTGTQAWEYFNIKSAEDKLASCTECEEILSYKENEDQLVDHLFLAHSITLQKDAATEKKDEESTVEYEVVEETHMAVSVWEYFDKKDESSETAICNLCEDVVSYKESLDKMLEHLLLKHDISKTYDEIQETESEADNIGMTIGGRNSRSAAWDYFKVSDRINKLAICKMCNETYSFKTSVTNLMKHARRHLGKDFRKKSLNQSNQSSSPTKPRLGQPSKAWHFFKSLSRTRKIAMCLVCKKRLSYATSVSNLKRHLHRKHPGTWNELVNMENGMESETEGENKRQIVVSTDDHEYELDAKSEEENCLSVDEDEGDQEENVEEMETVYLEEFEDQIRKRQEQRLTSNNRITTVAPKRSDLNGAIMDKSSRENIPVGSKRDTLDHFGSYIVSLMKQLPKNVSNRLQMDFVRQIMEAQLDQVTASENHSCDTLVANNSDTKND